MCLKKFKKRSEERLGISILNYLKIYTKKALTPTFKSIFLNND